MNIEQAAALLQETIRISLWLAAPVLLTALAAGLVISILQTATQVNEQTLTFVPKIVLTLGVFGLLFPWIMGTLVDFGDRIFDVIARGGGP
jgi:flagellar biosynthetic protein FliQ